MQHATFSICVHVLKLDLVISWKCLPAHTAVAVTLTLTMCGVVQLKTDDRPPHVISVLTEQLNVYEENDWLETITAELVDGASHLKAYWEAMLVVKATLSLSGLSETFFEEQIKVSSCLHGSLLP